MSKKEETKLTINTAKPVVKLVPLTDIEFGKKDGVKGAEVFTTHNVRNVETNFDFSKGADKQLLMSIRAEGLKDPPMLMVVKGRKKLRILKGNRRLMAVQQLAAGTAEGDKEAFNAHFGSGILAMVYEEELPDDVQWSLICDHQYMKKLSPLEQYYTVAKLFHLGWPAKEITDRVTGSAGFTARCNRIYKLSQSEDDNAVNLYMAALDRLAGKEGAPAVPDSVISAMVNALNSKDGLNDGKNEDFKGKDSSEIFAIWEAPEENLVKMATKAEIQKRVSVETDPVVVSVLNWVLGLEDWEAEPAN